MMRKQRIALVMAMLLACAMLLGSCGCKHEWAEATCTTPKTCTECGETEGEALGHTEGEATIDVDGFALKATSIVKCTNCDAVLSKEEQDVDTLLDGKYMLCSAQEYSDRLIDAIGQIPDCPLSVELIEQNGQPLCMVYNASETLVGAISFYGIEGDPIAYADKDVQSCFVIAAAYVPAGSADAATDLTHISIAMIMAAEPKMTVVDASYLVIDLVSEPIIVRDGVEYELDLTSDPDGYYCLICPEAINA